MTNQTERDRYLEILRGTEAKLRASLKEIPRKVISWSPAPGKWSILEIVGHLRDMERDAYLARYRRILSEDTPSLPDVDGDRLALENDYRSQKVFPLLREWVRLRKETLKLLEKAKPAEWERGGIHETAGRLTLADLLRRHAVGNDLAHLAQIDAIPARHAVLERLESTPARLAGALRAFSEEALRRPPQADKWSAIEIGCHLRDIDRLYAERVMKAAFSDRPHFWMMDNTDVARKLAYRDASTAAVLKEHRRGRQELASLLRSLPQGLWQRTGRHPTRGEITIEALASVIADHDDRHLAQIEALPKT